VDARHRLPRIPRGDPSPGCLVHSCVIHGCPSQSPCLAQGISRSLFLLYFLFLTILKDRLTPLHDLRLPHRLRSALPSRQSRAQALPPPPVSASARTSGSQPSKMSRSSVPAFHALSRCQECGKAETEHPGGGGAKVSNARSVFEQPAPPPSAPKPVALPAASSSVQDKTMKFEFSWNS
jgi:hypothetical protein